MKRALFISSLLIGIAISPSKASTPHIKVKVEYVLVCNSSSSYAYHRYECRGLAHCRHGISKITKAEAIRMGYRACKICY
jgi:hypothetical protein